MTGFDSIQVKFKNVYHFPSILSNTRIVPFVNSYLDILKSVIDDVETEYFWFFASFLKLDSTPEILDFIPEQHEKDQIHVWHTTHPKGGYNKEGNLFLIPTKKFKEQMHNLKFLRDYKDINYHDHPMLEQSLVSVVPFRLQDPYEAYQPTEPYFYKWMINRDLGPEYKPNFYPSFWEDEKLYSFGKTKDIMLVPYREKIEQFYDIPRSVHYEKEYPIKPMDIIFISYDEPGAEARYKKLKEKFPRVKWCKNIKGQTEAYHTAANMSNTDYFFAVFPKIDIVDDFKFDFQPDRMKNPCHYIFDCYNEVIDCTYGHDGVILYNRKLVLQTLFPGLDFTLSQPCTVVHQLSAINKLDETPLLAWRTAFREVLKLKVQLETKPTVETKFRLTKWLTKGVGKNAEWVYRGANDAVEYKEAGKSLEHSYDFEYIKSYFEEKYNEIRV